MVSVWPSAHGCAPGRPPRSRSSRVPAAERSLVSNGPHGRLRRRPRPDSTGPAGLPARSWAAPVRLDAVTGPSTQTDARRALLGALFDDAGLFPPASLAMPDAVAGHERARTGPHAWMLGRFVCPAVKLASLIEHAAGSPVRVSVILDTPDAAIRRRARAGPRPHPRAVPRAASPRTVR